jgi:hypothetical protein
MRQERRRSAHSHSHLRACKRGHIDHACVHAWLRLVLDLRPHTGKKELAWPAPARALNPVCPSVSSPCAALRACCVWYARKWQVNHDDKMRKVVYDSGASSDSTPGARRGGSVVRRDKSSA